MRDGRESVLRNENDLCRQKTWLTLLEDEHICEIGWPSGLSSSGTTIIEGLNMNAVSPPLLIDLAYLFVHVDYLPSTSGAQPAVTTRGMHRPGLFCLPGRL